MTPSTRLKQAPASKPPVVRGRVLLAAFLVLALVPGVADATAGVTLTRVQPSGDASAEVTGSQPVIVQTRYTLQLDRPMDLRLLTRVDAFDDGGSTAADHVAGWAVDGDNKGTSTRTTTATAQAVGAGSHEVLVTWSLGQLASGTYRLAATTREAPAATGGATGTVSSDRDEMLLHVVRQSSTSTTTSPAQTPTSSTSTSTTPSSSSAAPPPDTTPPPQVTGVQVTDATRGSLRVAWGAVSDPSGILSYEVFASASSGFDSGAETLVATATGTTFLHEGLAPSTTYAYRVRAVDGANNVGPLSPQATGRTLDPPDTTAPGAVTGLAVTKRTATTVALEWSPASDDRGSVTYSVARDGTTVGTTAGTRFTDDGLRPQDRPTYAVRAVDAAGNEGPAATLQAGAFEQDTVAAPQPSAQPLHITRVGTRTDGRDATVEWTTDETASGSIVLGAATRAVGPGVAFSETFTDLSPGRHQFTISMSASDGRTASRTGSVNIEQDRSAPPASREQASSGLALRLGEALGLQIADGQLFLEDRDNDGRPDSLHDAEGSLAATRTFPQRSLVLVQAVATGRVAIVALAGQTAEPVAPQVAVARGEQTLQELRKLVVDVPEKRGWIVVDVEDEFPDEPLLAVLAGNGTPLPSDAFWRSGGKIHFIDDPSVQYTLVFDHAGFAAASDEGSTASKGSGWSMAVIGFVAGAVVAAVAVLALMRRSLR